MGANAEPDGEPGLAGEIGTALGAAAAGSLHASVGAGETGTPERSASPSDGTDVPVVPGLDLEAELAELERSGGLRALPPAGVRGVDFSSNDYLGLSRRPELAEAAARAAHEHGAGGRASRLLAGGSREHEELEAEVARWLGTEAALLFPSGYQANLGLVGALVGRGDALFTDELDHASLVDAARLSRAHLTVFPHLDLVQLERALARAGSARRRLVAVESVFSMDGDLAPLAELDRVCARHDAWLVVDEAHAIGVLGPEGAGACAAAGELPRLVARTIAGGKGLGVGGALVAGSRSLVRLLVNRARTFLFTTAPPSSTAAALRAAIALARGADWERERVLELARRLAQKLALPEPASGIVPFPVGENARALELANELARHGLDVRAVRPPAVAAGTARLRIVCHAVNTESEIDELVHRLAPHTAPASAPARALAPCLVVAGTDTGVGKTVVSALLVRAALRLGPARYWKPVQTGPESDTAEVARLTGIAEKRVLRPAFAFPLAASPHEAARAAGTELGVAALRGSLAGLRRTLSDERVVVELAGGLCVPLRDDGWTQLDWLGVEALPIVLVAHSGLGTLNHTLLSLEALRARHLEPRALFLVGPEHASNRETLARLGHVEPIFEVPCFDPLDTAALDRWLDGAQPALLASLFR